MVGEFITIDGQRHPVAFDYCTDSGMSVELHTDCPECEADTDWGFDADPTGAQFVTCQSCETPYRIETQQTPKEKAS